MIGLGVATLILVLGKVHVTPTGNGFQAGVEHTDAGMPGSPGVNHAPTPSTIGAGSDASPSPGSWQITQVCALGGSQTCGQLAYCPDGSPQMEAKHTLPNGTVDADTIYCASSPPPKVSAPTGPSPDQVYSALKTVSLADSVLHFQPVGNETLVHFKSNYYTDGAPFDASVQLPVGPVTFHVDFKIAPTEFDWTFGDGTTLKTSTPGAPYPNLQVTHEYAKAGVVQAHVATVWGAQYRVNGGAWAPVNGTVTKTGADVSITVRQATPVLTD